MHDGVLWLTMSENPYIDGGGYLDDGPVKGSRTSVLAVGSLATSLLCCIPFLGVLSIILGAASLLLIGRSNGRLTGKGAAIAGLIVGIMTTVIWGAVGAGVLQAKTFYSKQMIPVGDAAMAAVQADDVSAMRALLNTKADGDLTDDQIRLFMAACHEEMGTIHGAEYDLGMILESFGETYQRSRGGNSGGGGQFDDADNPWPAPVGIVTSNGKFVVWVVFDSTTLKGEQDRKVADLLVMQTGQTGFTLRDDGPGRDMGDAMSLRTSTPSEALELMAKEEPAEVDLKGAINNAVENAIEESAVEGGGGGEGGNDG